MQFVSSARFVGHERLSRSSNGKVFQMVGGEERIRIENQVIIIPVKHMMFFTPVFR